MAGMIVRMSMTATFILGLRWCALIRHNLAKGAQRGLRPRVRVRMDMMLMGMDRR